MTRIPARAAPGDHLYDTPRSIPLLKMRAVSGPIAHGRIGIIGVPWVKMGIAGSTLALQADA